MFHRNLRNRDRSRNVFVGVVLVHSGIHFSVIIVLQYRQHEKEQRKERIVKIGSWNVGSMTGRGRELVEVCKRKNIGILCVQETKWTDKSARELGEGFKILYSE